MAITDILLDTAKADVDLLIKNDELGDVISRPRDVEFYLYAQSSEKADLVGSFIEDNRYGQVTRLDPADDGTFGIRVTIHMPIEQNIICSVSGLMACVAQIFSCTYDGWESALQTDA